MEAFVIGAFVGAILFGCLGSWIAGQKNREGTEGLFLGLLLGPFGCLIEALLPTLAEREAAPGLSVEQQVLERQREAKWLKNEQEQKRKLDEANREWRRAQIGRLERVVGRGWIWFRINIIGFRWYRCLPELLQMILLGVGIAVPVVGVMAWLFAH